MFLPIESTGTNGNRRIPNNVDSFYLNPVSPRRYSSAKGIFDLNFTGHSLVSQVHRDPYPLLTRASVYHGGEQNVLSIYSLANHQINISGGGDS